MYKRRIIVVLMALFIFFLTGCQKEEPREETYDSEVEDYEVVDSQLTDEVVYDEEMLSEYAKILQAYYDVYEGEDIDEEESGIYIGPDYQMDFESGMLLIPIFSLCDVNGDKIPELFIGERGQDGGSILDMYTYKQGEGAYLVGLNGFQTDFSLLEDGKIYIYQFAGGVFYEDSCYQLNQNGEMVLVAQTVMLWDEEKYYKKEGEQSVEVEISEEEYNAYDVRFGKKEVQPISNILTIEAIEDVKKGKFQVSDICDATEELTLFASQEEKLNECISFYNTVLLKKTQKNEGIEYALIYLTDDNIPELVAKDQEDRVWVYIYDNENRKFYEIGEDDEKGYSLLGNMSPTEEGMGVIWRYSYHEKKNRICGEIKDSKTYYKMNEDYAFEIEFEIDEGIVASEDGVIGDAYYMYKDGKQQEISETVYWGLFEGNLYGQDIYFVDLDYMMYHQMLLKLSSRERFLQESDFIIENGVLEGYIGADTKVVIPDGVTSIGKDVFCEYYKLEEVVIPKGVKHINDTAFAVSGLKKVVIPEGVVEIGDAVFCECGSLEELVLSEGLKTIGDVTFFACGFSEVVIPNTVTTIGKQAFGYCSNLSKIIIPESVTSIDDTAFEGILDNLTIYGKKNSYAHQYAKRNNIAFMEM